MFNELCGDGEGTQFIFVGISNRVTPSLPSDEESYHETGFRSRQNGCAI